MFLRQTGVEGSDYINANFVDVSRVSYSMYLELSEHFPRYIIGLSEEKGLHCHPGPTGLHREGLLEDDLGVPEQVHCHAVQLSGGRKGDVFRNMVWLLCPTPI